MFPGKPDRIGDLDQPALKRLAKLIPLNKPPGKKTSGADPTRSAKAFRAGLELRRQGKTFDEMCLALRDHTDPDVRAWYVDKGDKRQLRRIWDRSSAPGQDAIPPRYSDEALALRFSEIHSDALRYVARWGDWMAWAETQAVPRIVDSLVPHLVESANDCAIPVLLCPGYLDA